MLSVYTFAYTDSTLSKISFIKFVKDQTMTPEEHKLLIENNIMLKQILAYIRQRDNPKDDIKDFIINVVANVISNNN